MIDKLALWMQERDQAIEGLDVKKFRKFYKKWKNAGVYEIDLSDNDVIVLITMCIAALESNNVSFETKRKAEEILEI